MKKKYNQHLDPIKVGAFLAVVVALFVIGVAFASPAATPIDGGNSFGAATVITPGVEYIDSIAAGGDTSDYFRFDVQPGQRVTIDFTSGVTWGYAYFYLYDQNHTSALKTKTVGGPEQANQFFYMGNNSTPTSYYFVVSTPTLTDEYTFTVTVADQMDAGVNGDAGDTAGTFRLLNPAQGTTTTYLDNRLGGADQQDWYKINVLPGQRITMTVTIQDYGGTNGNLSAYMYDQSGTTQLKYEYRDYPSIIPIALPYMSNATTPSAYYFKIYGYNFLKDMRYRLDVELSQQADAGVEGDAGDTSLTARLITPAAGNINAYEGSLGYKDTDDWLKINAASGQQITVTVKILDWGGNQGNFYAYLQDYSSSAQLDSEYLGYPATDTLVMPWMSNNTVPSAYAIRLNGYNITTVMKYRVEIELNQQKDAEMDGDAGDQFDDACPITLTDTNTDLVALHNRLGGSDSKDYYLIKLPSSQYHPNRQFKFELKTATWPAGSGFITLKFYDVQRNLISSMGGTIHSPSLESINLDITECEAQGCYVELIASYSGYYQLTYELQVTAVNRSNNVYLPFLIK